MKRYGLIAAAVVLAACGSSSNTSPSPAPLPTTYVFTAQMVAANEVPPITNAEAGARGDVTITFNVTRDAASAITGGTANFVINLSSFPAGSTTTLAHIHNGAAGVVAPVFVNTGMTAATGTALTNGSASGITFSNIQLTAVQAQAVIDNPQGHYFNVHTVLNGGGAVRGQLVKQ